MPSDRKKNLDNPSDQEYIKQQLKAIKKAKKAGNEAKAQRLADELFQWLGWDDDGF
jgi:hypothetical protein